ncbi:hypothetical protein HUT16_35755 [Kitasatospora sp. NA04385]|uniref:hypothetical protein n=1 Tax=Kitasatospora sp. NA04385 TaxID=2742135 RepID=UPI00159293CB|nr:hypothetical protein [Kitasatospora sp. NA04385]QKW23746.1 hypothetical protein HUT16_35755 [Kitasatospora sp. NA04385]
MQRPSDLLDAPERRLLERALGEWGGPARSGNAMAYAMGFADAADLLVQCRRLSDALRADRPLSSADWARTLLATEVVFASDLVGSGVDWSTTTGWDDAETVRRLRSVQRKLGPVLRGRYGGRPD